MLQSAGIGYSTNEAAPTDAQRKVNIYMTNGRINKKYLIPLVGIVLIGMVAAVIIFPIGKNKEPLRFANIGTLWYFAPTILTVEGAFDRSYTVNFKSFDVSTGLAAKNAVLAGQADIAIVASTPLAIGAAREEDILILGSFMRSSHLMTILSKKGPSENTIISEPVGLVKGTSSEFYLIEYLRRKGQLSQYAQGNLSLVYLRPPGVIPAFTNADVNSVSIWEPTASDILRPRDGSKPIDNIQIVRDSDIYTLEMYLVTTPSIWKKRKAEILQFVGLISQAGSYIMDNQVEARKKIENRFGYPKQWLSPLFDKVDFSFSTNKAAMLNTIHADSRLALEAGILNSEGDAEYMFDVISDVEATLN